MLLSSEVCVFLGGDRGEFDCVCIYGSYGHFFFRSEYHYNPVFFEIEAKAEFLLGDLYMYLSGVPSHCTRKLSIMKFWHLHKTGLLVRFHFTRSHNS